VTNLQPDHEDFLRGFSDIGKLFVQRDKWMFWLSLAVLEIPPAAWKLIQGILLVYDSTPAPLYRIVRSHDGHAAIALLNTAYPRLLTLVINLGENQREVSAKYLPNIRMLKLY
jgi:hypothetical protein